MIDQAAADIRLTRGARDVLERAQAHAARRGQPALSSTDVLRAVLASRGSLADETLRNLGIDPAAVELSTNGAEPAAGPSLRQLLVNANREAQVLGHYQVDSIHLLLALLYSDSPATAASLQKAGVTLYDVRRQLQTAPRSATATAGTAAQARGATPDRALRRRPLPPLRGVLGVSPIFLGLLALVVVSGAVMWFNPVPAAAPFAALIFVVAGWVASVCVHEFGHAFVAYLGGDRSVVASGYLTLDPLRYTNIVLSIVMPVVFLLLGGIGLPGGAVYINHSALRSKRWDTAVSLAGPAGSLVCLILVSLPFFIPIAPLLYTSTNAVFFDALAFLAFVEAIAVILNLIPVPGLDGFGAIRPWLPYDVQASANRMGYFGILIVFALLWYVPPVRDAFFGTILHITDFLGVPTGLIANGSAHMRLQ
jgi:Zn-dependent protease